VAHFTHVLPLPLGLPTHKKLAPPLVSCMHFIRTIMSIIADLAATLFRILIRKVEPPHYSTTQSAVHCRSFSRARPCSDTSAGAASMQTFVFFHKLQRIIIQIRLRPGHQNAYKCNSLKSISASTLVASQKRLPS